MREAPCVPGMPHARCHDGRQHWRDGSAAPVLSDNGSRSHHRSACTEAALIPFLSRHGRVTYGRTWNRSCLGESVMHARGFTCPACGNPDIATIYRTDSTIYL